MENQTRFDLNSAIENWRQELAAQANLTAEVRRELETHLRDTVAELRQRGLNDEESFWLARRRVGQPPQLGEEFVKANPAAVWRERVFWMAVAILIIQLWSSAVKLFWGMTIGHLVSRYHFIHPFPDWIRFYLPLPSTIDLDSVLLSPVTYWLVLFLGFLPVIGIAMLLSKGRFDRSVSTFQFLFKSRQRFLFISTTLFCAYFLLILNLALRSDAGDVRNSTPSQMMFQLSLVHALFPAVLVALIAWLMPPKNRETSKHA